MRVMSHNQQHHRRKKMTALETSSAKNKRKKNVNDDINAHLDVKTKLARCDDIVVREAHEVIEIGSCCGSTRSSAGSDHADVDVASCCSYNNSIELVEHGEADPEEESDDEDSDQVESRSTYNPLRERREQMAPNYNNLRPQQTPVQGGRRGSTTMVENAKMPTDSELEEFFTAAEKVIQSKFSIKYNYDVTKDEALEGRYEWSRLKP